METWHEIRNVATLPSPALAIYPDRVRENIRRAIHMVGDPGRLRPHIKTHKMSGLIRMHLELGVTKFKCATLAEAEMAAHAGAKDVLVAMQLVGPNLQRFSTLRDSFPQTLFSTIADNEETINALNALGGRMPVFVDVNCGMDRTGAAIDQTADLYKAVQRQRNLVAAGLHAYDGHIHDPDPAVRAAQCEQAFARVVALRGQLGARKLIASGTPTYPMHARHSDRECSPGTYVFWDFGYQKFPDLPFQIAALLVTRVVSKPGPNKVTLDLGYKAVASESPHPRVQFLNLPDATAGIHSEEHLVLETSRAGQLRVGDVLYGIPRHICPTVALHDEAYPVVNGVAGDPWPVEARRRRITI